jgi:hypothetical protein
VFPFWIFSSISIFPNNNIKELKWKLPVRVLVSKSKYMKYKFVYEINIDTRWQLRVCITYYLTIIKLKNANKTISSGKLFSKLTIPKLKKKKKKKIQIRCTFIYLFVPFITKLRCTHWLGFIIFILNPTALHYANLKFLINFCRCIQRPVCGNRLYLQFRMCICKQLIWDRVFISSFVCNSFILCRLIIFSIVDRYNRTWIPFVTIHIKR